MQAHAVKAPCTPLPNHFREDGANQYAAHIFADAPNAGDYPDRVDEQRRTAVTSEDTLVLQMAPAGGYAAILAPK